MELLFDRDHKAFRCSFCLKKERKCKNDSAHVLIDLLPFYATFLWRKCKTEI